jgi:hypothetical protein
MSFKVVRNNGTLVCYGPNDDNYEPSLKEGDVISIEETQPKTVETGEQTISRLDNAIESHIQTIVKAMGYNNLERMAVYLSSTNPTWAAEAAAAPKWVTALWEKALVIQADVEADKRPIPSEIELIAEMPLFKDFL